jgi:GT2 family glycosyltransferase
MDDDTAADPFWVRSLAESFAAFPQAGAVTGLTLPLKLETEAQAMFEAYGGFARGFARRVLPCDDQRILGRRLPLIAEAIGVGSGCNMAFRSAVLRELNGFDEALDTGAPLPGGGDLDIFYRVLRAGYQFLYEPRAIIRHRHRRSKTGLRRQLAGHYRSVSAFLVKTFGSERGFARISVASFLAWRIAKNGYRLIRSLAGRDVLPITFNAHIFAAGLAGLGSYHASKWRIRGQTG